MLCGSYLAGSVPLFMTMSEDILQLVSVMGAGLLIGVALAVIVPEGMQTLIKAYQMKEKASHSTEETHHESHNHSHSELEGIDRTIGLSLILGFLFMLLIDQIASKSSGGSHQSVPSSDIESGSSPKSSPRKNRTSSVSHSHNHHGTTWTTTLGLLVHAAADGIAMGSAAATHHVDVEFIVFLAIMLHKAPAAFGLVTFLLHEQMERTKIRKHLLTFSFAAPTLALITYILLATNGDVGGKMDTFQATGVAMLFSAGTFLYVSTVHVLPEVTSKGHGSGFSKCELMMLVIGTLVPLLLTFGHHH